ncbi:MAG: flagellar basal body rod protein FlgB [Pirellulaceae bacterium]
MIGKSSQIDTLSAMLQQAEVRHRVVSQNIANVNTPGYRNLDVSFQESLDKLASDPALQAIVEETQGLVMREDGNNVDLDRELGKLTKNSLQFETYSHLLLAKFSLLRSAITGQ